MAAAKPVRKMRFNHFKVFSGNANPVLAKEICYELGCQLAVANVKQFSDGEVHFRFRRMSAARTFSWSSRLAGRWTPT